MTAWIFQAVFLAVSQHLPDFANFIHDFNILAVQTLVFAFELLEFALHLLHFVSSFKELAYLFVGNEHGEITNATKAV